MTHLILYGGYARGRFRRDLSPEQRLEAETMINAIRLGWGRDNPAFRQLFSTQLMPEGSESHMRQLNALARDSAAPETAARMEEAFYGIDVTALAPQVSVPTLVLHARQDAACLFEEGRRLAALIRGARFVPLQSNNHILLETEPAWTRFVEEVRGFLDNAEPAESAPATGFPDLTRRERDVLELIACGLSNPQIAARLSISEKTVRNHITHIFSKLAVKRRAEAIVRAREAGFGRSRLPRSAPGT